MKEIPLTRGKVAIVDDEDYEHLSQYKWYYSSTGYGCRKTYGIVYIHRLVMGNPKGLEVDHINRNRLDNRKENLRIVEKYENLLNKEKRKNTVCKYKGVRMKIDTHRNKPYYATIYINKKKIHLGYFSNEDDAAKAYDKAALKYHGQFAKLNFPKEMYI